MAWGKSRCASCNRRNAPGFSPAQSGNAVLDGFFGIRDRITYGLPHLCQDLLRFLRDPGNVFIDGLRFSSTLHGFLFSSKRLYSSIENYRECYWRRCCKVRSTITRVNQLLRSGIASEGWLFCTDPHTGSGNHPGRRPLRSIPPSR